MSWVIFIIAPLFFLIPVLVFRPSPWNESVKNRIERNRSIADFSFFHAQSLPHRLRLRAGPNARLITAFGIHNSLTTTDEAEHKKFLRYAVRTIKRADGAAWNRVWILASETLDVLASHLYDHVHLGVSLERAARILCFDAVLELLFPHTRARPVDIDAADRVTSTINGLWLESKKQSDEASLVFQRQTLSILHKIIDELVPGQGDDTLALIVPAYETLWRVVLLTYVHIAFRRIDDETRVLVKEVIKNVSEFGVGGSLHVSVDNFSREALRLYPPTKRIYRASPFGQKAADVESLHHDERIWGFDALDLRPSRFNTLTRNQKDAYMPFSVGMHTCPAASGFGRKIIALLVVVLTKRLGTRESGAQIWFGDEVLDGDITVPLPTGRDNMRGWFVVSSARE